MINIKTVLVSVITIVLVLMGSSVVALAETEYEYKAGDGNVFGYRIETDDSITITKYYYDSNEIAYPTKLIIPDKIDGKKVKRVNKIYGWDGLKEIVFSDYMTEVDMKSFVGAKNLERVTLGKYTKRIKTFLPYYSCLCNLDYKIAVPPDAKYLKIAKGALYSKDGTVLFKVNMAKNFVPLNSVKTIKSYIFSKSIKCKSIKLGTKINKIEEHAFSSGDVDIIKVPKNKVKKYKKLLRKSCGGYKDWRSMYNVKLVTY